MDVLNDIISAVESNPLQIINLILILLTLMVASSSYASQSRNGLRESLEQLVDLKATDSIMVRVLLHDFSFWGRTATLQFKFYEFDTENQRIGKPRDPSGYTLDKLTCVNCHVENACDNGGLFVKCDTINSIACRQVAEDVLDHIYDSHN